MGQLEYVNGMCNNGYEEIEKEDCPVKWGKKRKVIYLKRDNWYAMVDQHGHFVHWEHPNETEKVRARYEIKKEPKMGGYWGEKSTNNWW